MADNLELNAGSGGANLLTAELTWSNDTAELQGTFSGILSGSEGSWSFAQLVGGAGAVSAGVQRMTLASDDPAVAKLGTIDTDTGNIATAVQVMDDWDESDRCKVNPIAGQAGIAGGTGVDGATVPRVTLATDVPLPAGDNNIGNVDVASVPAPLNVVGGGTEAAALRVTLANDSTGVVSVDDGGGALTVDGTVTANAGTNLNTSALALESGGNLAATATALQIIDDWDDGSDHCEVVGAAAEDAAVVGAPVLVGGRYDSTARTLDNGDVGAMALSAAGEVIAIPQAGYVMNGATRCQIKRASGLAASGTVAMVEAVASKKIRVLAMALFATSATATNVYVANDDNDILGDASNPIPLAVDADGDNVGGFVLPWNPGGWFETDTANEALNVVLSAAQDVIYGLTYIEVD